MSRPIVVETTREADGFPKGARLGYDSEAQARKVLGDGFTVVSYQDGTEYEAPERKGAKKADER